MPIGLLMRQALHRHGAHASARQLLKPGAAMCRASQGAGSANRRAHTAAHERLFDRQQLHVTSPPEQALHVHDEALAVGAQRVVAHQQQQLTRTLAVACSRIEAFTSWTGSSQALLQFDMQQAPLRRQDSCRHWEASI